MKKGLRHWDGWIIYGVIFLLQIVAGLFVFVFQLLFQDPQNLKELLSASGLLLTALTYQLLIILVGVAALLLRGHSPGKEFLRPPAPVLFYIFAVTGTFGAGAAADEVASLMRDLIPPLFDWGTLENLTLFFQEGSFRQFLAGCAVICLLAGIAEEFVFRGVLFKSFRGRYGAFATICLTSLLFALLHIDPVQGAGALVVGLFFGIVRELTGSVMICVVAHGFNNFLSALFARYLLNPLTEFPLWDFSLANLAVGLLIAALSLTGLVPGLRSCKCAISPMSSTRENNGR